MGTRYFEIRSPRADFTGHVGAIAFADGVARVSFDDTRQEREVRVDGKTVTETWSPADEQRVQVGRSAVLFAQRRGYGLVEVDATGQPLKSDEQDEAKPARTTTTPKGTSR